MNHLQLLAIEKFAAKLKVNFPILLKPKDFSDEIINIHNAHTHKIIDMEVERAQDEFNQEVEKEAKHYGK